MALIDNLISYWKLDDNLATTNVIDIHDGNAGTASKNTNLLSAPGKINTSFDFDGINDDVIIPDDPSLNPSDISISVWVNPDTIAAGNHFIIAKLLDYQLWHVSGQVHIASNPFTTVGTGYFLPTGTWTHLVFTHDTAAAKRILYANGANVYEDAAAGAVPDNANNLEFGRRGGVGGFDGREDEIGIWARALGPAEAAALWNDGNGLPYPFAVVTNMQINIADVWKDVNSIQINVGDVWKDVAGVQINIGDVWKDVF